MGRGSEEEGGAKGDGLGWWFKGKGITTEYIGIDTAEGGREMNIDVSYAIDQTRDSIPPWKGSC